MDIQGGGHMCMRGLSKMFFSCTDFLNKSVDASVPFFFFLDFMLTKLLIIREN